MENSAPLRSYMQNRSPEGFDTEGSDSAQPYCLSDHVNVGDTERSISLALGGFAVVSGLCRGSLGGLLTALIGGGLVYRGLTGNCPLYEKLEMSTAGGHRDGQGQLGRQGHVESPRGEDMVNSPNNPYSTGLA